MTEQVSMRKVVVRGIAYLRAEDVQRLLLLFAEAEETDTRNRIRELARNLDSLN